MTPKRATRNAPRTRGPSGRSRGATTTQAKLTRLSASNAGIWKTAPSSEKRPVQRRIAKALQSIPPDAVEVLTQAEGAESPPKLHEPEAKVHRIMRDTMCSLWSLDFIYHIHITDEQGEAVIQCLETSEDTDTIALNLMDHFMQPGNEVPGLRYGILPAASFALACDLTKISKDFERIAQAVRIRVAMCSEMGGELAPEALELTGPDVRKDYDVMLERRKELYPLVGGYAQELAHLARTVLGLEEVDEEFRHHSRKEGEARGEEEGGNADDNPDLTVDKLELTVDDEAAAVEDLMEAGMKNAEEEELIDFDVFDESEVDGV
ncbi:hypothetical protein KC343_g13775 [Hortaea werneckii]|nr:hypothetical protein KC352_g25000 [Hortaea werneckii]KAI7551811.1 hypothetical protein KC317_g13912 [Hortaea werneckii]KAI7599309.1 hypothetical protein KC346_g13790 [Hortaea werneckii]KAI7605302.1 hypothetical protein KC343_g13775 [Hortaea werneckii]KAI7641390.1 hypothetical protein KC319_g13520 [Hortaea werneckii]